MSYPRDESIAQWRLHHIRSYDLGRFQIEEIDSELLDWAISYSGTTIWSDNTLNQFNNPVCDLIGAGLTEAEVSTYLWYLKVSLMDEPDPGYNDDNIPDPYSAYNIENTIANSNKVTQFLIDYPCIKPTDNLGVILSKPEVVDWAISFLDGDCSDVNKNKYVTLAFDAIMMNDDIAFEAIDTFGWFLLADILPELLITHPHKASFPMTKIGDAYYCQTNFINLGFWHELNPWNWVSFCIPNLCIQVPTQNSDGPFNIHEVPRNTVKAFDKTRKALLEMARIGTITTSAEGRSAFVTTFEDELRKIFDVNLLNVTANQNTCDNECNIANYGVDVKVGKASPAECVYDEN